MQKILTMMIIIVIMLMMMMVNESNKTKKKCIKVNQRMRYNVRSAAVQQHDRRYGGKNRKMQQHFAGKEVHSLEQRSRSRKKK